MGECNLIFVTVGNSSWSFNRLIEEMDRIAGKVDEEMVIQIGYTECEPKNAKYFRFMSKEEIEKLYENVRVVVSHAGVGTIVSAIRNNKQIIVVPRRKKYGEVFDDHQVEIARELENEGRIKIVWEVKDLEGVLNDMNRDFTDIKKDKTLVLALRDYVNNL